MSATREFVEPFTAPPLNPTMKIKTFKTLVSADHATPSNPAAGAGCRSSTL
jgi:hypothetical protein